MIMETYNLKNGRKLVIEQCEYADSPREWDNLTKCLFFGSFRYLGDKHNYNSDDYNGWEEMEADIMKKEDVVIISKVYGYSHGGLTISLSPFDCRWDSGVLGFVIITKADLRSNYGWKLITQKRLDSVMDSINNTMEAEIKVLDEYITGSVYQFSIQAENGDTEDSCSGFYGYDIKSNGILEYLSQEDTEMVLEQL